MINRFNNCIQKNDILSGDGMSTFIFPKYVILLFIYYYDTFIFLLYITNFHPKQFQK